MSPVCLSQILCEFSGTPVTNDVCMRRAIEAAAVHEEVAEAFYYGHTEVMVCAVRPKSPPNPGKMKKLFVATRNHAFYCLVQYICRLYKYRSLSLVNFLTS